MPDTVMKPIPDSRPTIRMKDFVEFLLNNMSESEQNESIKIIVESVKNSRANEFTAHSKRCDEIDTATRRLEDILKADC